jgi:hypothetical protein
MCYQSLALMAESAGREPIDNNSIAYYSISTKVRKECMSGMYVKIFNICDPITSLR